MPSKYAKNTSVAVGRTKAEIEKTLRKYEADNIVFGESKKLSKAFVQFEYRKLNIEITIRLPDSGEKRFWRTPSGRKTRTLDQATIEWGKACRQQWRVLLLLIKAQLEAIENDVISAQDAFLPWLRLPTGRTLGAEISPHIESMIKTGNVPKLLAFEEAKEQ